MPAPRRHRPPVLRQALLAVHDAATASSATGASTRATERPAETTEQCGDHWTRVVNLSQRVAVLHGAVQRDGAAGLGEAARPSSISTSVSVVRFTWDGGWIDFWIDDVGFYKHRSTRAVTPPTRTATGSGSGTSRSPTPPGSPRRAARARRSTCPRPTPTLAAARDELARGLARAAGRAPFVLRQPPPTRR